VLTCDCLFPYIVKPARCIIFRVYWISLYMFRRSFRPSSGVQDCTYSIRYMSHRFLDRMLACSQGTCGTWVNLMLYVQSWTPDDGRKDRPKPVEWYSINSKNCASSWSYYRNITRCTVPWTLNFFYFLLLFVG